MRRIGVGLGVLSLGVGEVEHSVIVLPRDARAPAADGGRDGGAHGRLAAHALQDLLLLVRIFVDLERLVARGGSVPPPTEGDLLLGPVTAASLAPLRGRDHLVLWSCFDESNGHPIRFKTLPVETADRLPRPPITITGHVALL